MSGSSVSSCSPPDCLPTESTRLRFAPPPPSPPPAVSRQNAVSLPRPQARLSPSVTKKLVKTGPREVSWAFERDAGRRSICLPRGLAGSPGAASLPTTCPNTSKYAQERREEMQAEAAGEEDGGEAARPSPLQSWQAECVTFGPLIHRRRSSSGSTSSSTTLPTTRWRW